jgi:hypothetical protein
MANTSIPQTENREHGFFGTMSHHADPERAWDIALAFIAGTTGCSPDATRAFLDSRYGRHFADEVSNHLTAGKALASAINAATATWMGWRISARTAHETGIPRGLPYLTGYVLHAEIEADTAE